ncbi:hypothetical protein R1E67_18885, partial [Escherichia coli]|nr:hypothetical protein [Escherichia coli]
METNIVEVENFVQQSEERRGSAFTQEVKRYLERYPNTQYVDVLLTDLNRPGFPGECFICELRLPDHRFRWKHNKLFLLLPEEY